MKSILGYGVLPCLILSGLFLNILQLFIYFLVRPFSERLFRKINHNLQFSCWSQTVAVVDWCTNVKVHMTYENEVSKREFGKNSCLVIANHRYDIDWLAAWMLSDKLHTLGNDKAIMKSSLKYVPVIGWGWSLNDMMFVSRDWNKDRATVDKSMERLLTYEKAPLLAYFEGTRFTEAKHAASLKFAEDNNIPLRLKHHLLPRTKGFLLLAKKIRTNYDKCSSEKYKNDVEMINRSKYGIYNFQLAIKSDKPITMSSLLNGQSADLYFHSELITPDRIPETDDKIVEFLYEIYKKKDELHEYFLKNGKFPDTYSMEYKPQLKTLINWIFWMSLVYGTFFYHFLGTLYHGLTNEFTTGGLIFLGSTMVLIATMCVAIKYMIDSTKVSRSSNYGINKPKSS